MRMRTRTITWSFPMTILYSNKCNFLLDNCFISCLMTASSIAELSGSWRTLFIVPVVAQIVHPFDYCQTVVCCASPPVGLRQCYKLLKLWGCKHFTCWHEPSHVGCKFSLQLLSFLPVPPLNSISFEKALWFLSWSYSCIHSTNFLRNKIKTL